MRITLLFFLLTLTSVLASAQTLEEYEVLKNKREAAFLENKQTQWEKDELIQKEWVKQRDSVFAAYLEKKWTSFRLHTSRKEGIPNKPDTVPFFEPEKTKDPSKPSPIQDSDSAASSFHPGNVLHYSAPPSYASYSGATEDYTLPHQFRFFGNTVDCAVDSNLANQTLTNVQESVIASHWISLSASNYQATIQSLTEWKEIFNLNDYGYYLLIDSLCSSLCQDSKNLKTSLQWFFLIRSGYAAKIARNDGSLYVMIPSWNEIFGYPYIGSGRDIRYWLLSDKDIEVVEMLDFDYHLKGRIVDFQLHSPPTLGGDIREKIIELDIPAEGKVSFSFFYESRLIDFYRAYPNTNLEVHFNAGLSTTSFESIEQALEPMLRGKSDLEVVSFLLNLMHQSFPYASDIRQFGEENFFFPEELLHYPFSDCEDRAVFFSCLVRMFTRLEIIGTLFPRHIATAIRFEEELPGANGIILEGHPYYYADPTHINAPVGCIEEKFLEASPVLVEISSHNAPRQGRIPAVWREVKDQISTPGVYQNMLVLPGEEGVLIAGRLKENLQLTDTNLSGTLSDQGLILHLDRNGNYLQHLRVDFSKSSLPLEVIPFSEDIILSGLWSREARGTDGKDDSSPFEGIFMARLSRDLQSIKWFKSELLHPPSSAHHQYDFQYYVDENGETEYLSIFPKTSQSLSYATGWQPSAKKILFSGSVRFPQMLTMHSTLAVEEISQYSIPELLKQLYDAYLDEKTEPSIAGLFATTQLIEQYSPHLSGKDIQRTFQKYNPDFIQSNKPLYETIGSIKSIDRQHKQFRIKLAKDYVDVMLMRIQDDARMALVPLSNGDIQINIEDGFEVSQNQKVWARVNHIVLDKHKGDLVIAFQKLMIKDTRRVNILKEILQ